MKKTITFVLLVLMTAVTKAQNFYDESGGYFGPTYEDKNYSGAYYTGDYTSPFKTYLNKTDEEIQKKYYAEFSKTLKPQQLIRIFGQQRPQGQRGQQGNQQGQRGQRGNGGRGGFGGPGGGFGGGGFGGPF